MNKHSSSFLAIYRDYHSFDRPRKAVECVEALAQTELSVNDAKQRLLRLDTGFSRLPKRLLDDLTFTATGKGLESGEINRTLRSLEADLMDAPGWFMLSSVLLALGEFHSALLARELGKARIRQYQRGLRSPLFCDLIIGLLLEDWNSGSLKSQLRIARWLRTECGRNRANPLLARLVSNESSDRHDQADQPYANFIKDRSVAVIGPLELSPDALEEIDGFNLTVGINDIRCFSGQTDSNLIHPDVVYLVGSVQQKMRSKDLPAERQPPRFIVGKHRSPGFTASDTRSGYRAISQYNHFMLNGSLNMLPRVVLDLAFFSPEKIKVFGADLYTSRNYRNDYGGCAHESDKTILRQHIGHDLITQYRLLQNLFLNGHFQADTRLGNVLNMGLESYLAIFQGSAANA